MILDYVPLLTPLVQKNFPQLNLPDRPYQLIPDNQIEDRNAKPTSYLSKLPSPCILSKRVGDIDRQAAVSPGGLFAVTNVLATGVGGFATTSTLDNVALVLGNAGTSLTSAESAIASFASSASAAAAAAAAAASLYAITCTYTATGIDTSKITTAKCIIGSDELAFDPLTSNSVTSTKKYAAGDYSVDVQIITMVGGGPTAVAWDVASTTVTVSNADVSQAFTMANSGVCIHSCEWTQPMRHTVLVIVHQPVTLT